MSFSHFAHVIHFPFDQWRPEVIFLLHRTTKANTQENSSIQVQLLAWDRGMSGDGQALSEVAKTDEKETNTQTKKRQDKLGKQ